MSSITIEDILPLVHITDNELFKNITRNEKDIYFHLLIYSHLFNKNINQSANDNLLLSAKQLCETLRLINENKEKTNLKTQLFSEIKKMTNEKKNKKPEPTPEPESVIKKIVDNYYDENKKNDINTSITNQILSAVLNDKKNKSKEVIMKKSDRNIGGDTAIVENNEKISDKPVAKIVLKKKKKIIIKNDGSGLGAHPEEI